MDPSLGRFITADPVKDFLNPYSYVGNNPMNRIDPTGMRGLPGIMLSVIPAFISSEANRPQDPTKVIAALAEAAEKYNQYKYITSLMSDASDRARAMKEMTWDDGLKRDWGTVADVLSEWAGMTFNEFEAFVTIVDMGSAEAMLSPKWDDEGSGELISTKLFLNKDTFFGGNYSKTDLIGILIHEAQHQSFYNMFPNYKKFQKDTKLTYNWMQEEFAYKRQLDYISLPRNINKISLMRLNAEEWAGNNSKMKKWMLESLIRGSLAVGSFGL